MSGSKALTNPRGAHKEVTTFIGGRYADGTPFDLPQETESWRANAAITRGQAVSWVAPTATAPISVTPMTTTTADFLFAGAALESAAAGDQVLICKEGFCEILIDASDTAAALDVIRVPDATDGSFATGTAEVDETASVGVGFGTEVGTNFAQAWISRAGVPHIFETVA